MEVSSEFFIYIFPPNVLVALFISLWLLLGNHFGLIELAFDLKFEARGFCLIKLLDLKIQKRVKRIWQFHVFLL